MGRNLKLRSGRSLGDIIQAGPNLQKLRSRRGLPPDEPLPHNPLTTWPSDHAGRRRTARQLWRRARRPRVSERHFFRGARDRQSRQRAGPVRQAALSGCRPGRQCLRVRYDRPRTEIRLERQLSAAMADAGDRARPAEGHGARSRRKHRRRRAALLADQPLHAGGPAGVAVGRAWPGTGRVVVPSRSRDRAGRLGVHQ